MFLPGGSIATAVILCDLSVQKIPLFVSFRILYLLKSLSSIMKFIVSSSALLKQLQQISGVINANTVLPILEDFLFDVEKNKLTVVATDLETVMKVQLDIEAKDTGRVCIPARILMDSLKNIPDQPLTFTIDKNFGVEITSDNGKYKVMGENPDNFPKEPVADDTSSFDMTSSALVTAINKTLFAVSSDDLRPAMTGVFFEMDKKGLQPMHTGWYVTNARM